MQERDCYPGRRVVISLPGHHELKGTIVEVLPFQYRGRGARIVVQCDEHQGSEYSNTRREFHCDELRPLEAR